ncbi:MAG: A/G-specific adenine glycosylase [Phycisphaerales bacterium]|nr:MAG: A/G-specific adenine glycosylase [Phycisphaerales bacterium]
MRDSTGDMTVRLPARDKGCRAGGVNTPALSTDVAVSGSALRRRLLGWYGRRARDLPWRRRPHDVYAQWLAEMMLQQTRVETVLPYYRRFRQRFPTVGSLAHARLQDVLKLWVGMGYYRRARYLHSAARQVMNEHGGRFPQTLEGLCSLPGVGRSTAGSIASIAFDSRVPVLDGNVTRVLTRLFAVHDDISLASTRQRLWELAETLLPRTRCGDFNQAMMELGATLCAARSPRCGECPLRAHCRGLAEGLQEQLPRKRRAVRVSRLRIAIFVVPAGDYVLLGRRPPVGLWAGLWAPPEVVRDACSKGPVRPERILPAAVSALLVRVCRLGAVEHQLTHRRVRFAVFLCNLQSDIRPRLPVSDNGSSYRWVHRGRLEGVPLSRAHRKVLDLWPCAPRGSETSR